MPVSYFRDSGSDESNLAERPSASKNRTKLALSLLLLFRVTSPTFRRVIKDAVHKHLNWKIVESIYFNFRVLSNRSFVRWGFTIWLHVLSCCLSHSLARSSGGRPSDDLLWNL